MCILWGGWDRGGYGDFEIVSDRAEKWCSDRPRYR